MKFLKFIGLNILSLVLFYSCAGYHVNYNDNPLLSYDIKTLSVPMFINRSVFPHIASPMTQEVVKVLNQYHDLKVIPGEDLGADGVLVGIIESDEKISEVLKTKSQGFSEGKNSTGNRLDFYYPNEQSYQLKLRIVLIKNPSENELKLLNSNFTEFMKLHSKVIIDEKISLSNNFSRVANDSTATGGGDVNFVKNEGIFERSIQEVSRNAATSFRDLILNAF
jgi:hypothetical protein